MNRIRLCWKAHVARAHGPASMLAVLAATIFGACAGEQNAVPSERDDLIRRSSYIFTGTVREVGASTVKLVPAGDNTAVVRVDHVAKGDNTVGDFTGEDVTVVLQKPKSVAVGDRFHFYTNPKVSSGSLAVEEVGHTPIIAGEEVGTVRARAAQLTKESAAKKIGDHAMQADLVVTGRVTSTKPVPREDGRGPGSEHDPDWWEATIQVQGVERGTAPANNLITAYYPHSRDIRWFGVPKLDKIKEGVFFLHTQMQPKAEGKGKEPQAEAFEIKGFKVLHPEDVHPVASLDEIRTMIRSRQ